MNLIFKYTVLAAKLMLISLFSISVIYAQAGAVDSTFNGGAFIQPQGSGYAVARQADGKILFGGIFSVVNGQARNSLVRVSGDNGTIDSTFNPPTNFLGAIRVIVPLSDGKILIGGSFGIGNMQTIVARLNSDGSLDGSFQLIPFSSGGTVYDIAVLPDGKVIIAGDFAFSIGGNTRVKIARLNADGTNDAAFSPPNNSLYLEDVEVQADGKVIGASTFTGSTTRFLKRYNTDGSEDATFNVVLTVTTNDNGLALRIQPDGKILIAGSFTFVNNTAKSKIARLNADGTLDNSFDASSGNGILPEIFDIEIDANGKIVVGGYAYNNGANRRAVARLESSGALDTTFNFTTDPITPISIVYDVLPLPDGKVLVAGNKANTTYSGGAAARLNADGTTDTSFSVLLGGVGLVNEIAVQPDGKILVAGNFGGINAVSRAQLGRFNPDGTTDTTFNPNFGGSFPYISALTVQPDGKILIGGLFIERFMRLNPDGSRDTTFNVPANVPNPYDIAVLPDGKILSVGGGVYRLNADGSADSTFTPATTEGGIGEKVSALPDGKFFIGGSFNSVNGTPRGKIARLNQNGSLDTAFNPLGGANQTVYDLVVQADGKVVIGGVFTQLNGASKSYLARLNADGTTDSTFNANLNNVVYAIEMQPNGKLLVGGNFSTADGALRSRLARLNADGSLDTTFQIGTGAVGTGSFGSSLVITALALQPNGRIIAGGNFSFFNGVSKIAIVRLLNDFTGRTPFDFDGDGKADVAVFRPSNGFWYELRSQNNSFYALQFGQQGDQIAPADFDGDGKTDIAVWRPGTFAYFYIFQSSNNTFRFEQFGQTGDQPLSGDWDGDGKADAAVYRGANTPQQASFFYYRPSTQPNVSYNTIGLGVLGDKPLYGDFDGDGRLDAAVFRPSNGQWSIRRSSDNQTVNVTFGATDDIPVPADYDGDGMTNIAVFRPSTGYWYTSQNPATNFGAVFFGTSGDLPIPADYDGDGRADVAVYRPAAGAWYLNRSTQGFAGIAFGASEDKPIPNAFIR